MPAATAADTPACESSITTQRAGAKLIRSAARLGERLDHLADARDRPQLGAESLGIGGADALHEIRRQSPAPLLLDAVDHGAHADAGIAGEAVVRRQRKSDRGELARQHAGGDDLGIDEDAVAVEDDEGGSRGNGHLICTCPLSGACLGRSAPAIGGVDGLRAATCTCEDCAH
jgi:hypothetical protein